MGRLLRQFPANHHRFRPTVIGNALVMNATHGGASSTGRGSLFEANGLGGTHGGSSSTGRGALAVVRAPSPSRPYRGLITEEYFLEAVDSRGRHVGLLDSDTVARIDGVTDAPVARKLSGILLRPGSWEEFDFRKTYIKPWVVIEGTPYELGRFYAVTKPKHRSWRGVYRELQCQDIGYRLQSTFAASANVVPGDVITTRIAALINEVNVYDYVLSRRGTRSTAFLGAPIGSPRYDFLSTLCKLVGLTPPWYDRFGVAQMVPIPYAGYTKPIDVDAYNPGEKSPVVDDTITEDDEEWNIPTGWLVVGKSDQGVQYAGRHDLPNTHPMSSFQRDGYVNLKVVEMSGVASQDDADARARDQAQFDTKVNATVEFDARTTPKLEPWSIVTYLGGDWLLDSWTHTLQSGVPQHVKVRESVLV